MLDAAGMIINANVPVKMPVIWRRFPNDLNPIDEAGAGVFFTTSFHRIMLKSSTMFAVT